LLTFLNGDSKQIKFKAKMAFEINFRSKMSGLNLLKLPKPKKEKTKRQLLLQDLAGRMQKQGGASKEM